MATTQPILVHELIQLLIATNKAILGRFVGMLELIAANLSNASAPSPLQGEAAEVLRVVVQDIGKAIEQLLTVQGQLQVAIIESYFPTRFDASPHVP